MVNCHDFQDGDSFWHAIMLDFHSIFGACPTRLPTNLYVIQWSAGIRWTHTLNKNDAQHLFDPEIQHGRHSEWKQGWLIMGPHSSSWTKRYQNNQGSKSLNIMSTLYWRGGSHIQILPELPGWLSIVLTCLIHYLAWRKQVQNSKNARHLWRCKMGPKFCAGISQVESEWWKSISHLLFHGS